LLGGVELDKLGAIRQRASRQHTSVAVPQDWRVTASNDGKVQLGRDGISSVIVGVLPQQPSIAVRGPSTGLDLEGLRARHQSLLKGR